MCGSVISGDVVGSCEGKCDACQSRCVGRGGLGVESCVIEMVVGVTCGIWSGGLTLVRVGVGVGWHRVGRDVLLWVWIVLFSGLGEAVRVER